MSLIKSLPRIAARVLHNTHCGLRNLKFKLELVSEAYGTAAVEQDFEKWCHSISGMMDNIPKYPIFEYMKVIDVRLGSAPEEQRANLEHPAILELQSLAYELTGMLPAKKAIANVLVTYSPDEITGALREYTEDLPEKDVKADMRAFWAEGGAEAIILARRRRSSQGTIPA
jgi:hypothetical protein